MAAIGMAESRGRSDAVSPHGARGIWQIYPKAWPDLAKRFNLDDPYENAQAMAIVRQKQGLEAWDVTGIREGTAFTRGTSSDFRKYLGEAQRAAGMSDTGWPTEPFGYGTFPMGEDTPIWPVPGGTTGQGLGHPRPNGGVHEGVDIMAPTGSPIYAVTGGRVIYAARRSSDNVARGAGIAVAIEDAQGNVHKYFHMDPSSQQLWQQNGIYAGTTVRPGTIIGYVGYSGSASSSAPHLHYEVRSGAQQGPAMDPIAYLEGSQQPGQPFGRNTQSFGFGDWVYKDPELATVFRRAVAEDWDEATFQNEIQNTDWWRLNSNSIRAWQELQASDPATAEQQVQQMTAQLQDQANQLGIEIDPGRMAMLAEQAIMLNWNPSQIEDALIAELEYDPTGAKRGSLATNTATVQRMAAQYLLKLGDEEVFNMAKSILDGTNSLEGVEELLREQAVGKFPSLAPQIEQGIRPDDILAPLRSEVAGMLEMSPNQIDFINDRTWAPLMQYWDGEQMRPMSIQEAGLWSRSLPEFDTTNRANAEVDSLMQSMGSMWGVR